jgi:hypothetical protein
MSFSSRAPTPGWTLDWLKHGVLIGGPSIAVDPSGQVLVESTDGVCNQTGCVLTVRKMQREAG